MNDDYTVLLMTPGDLQDGAPFDNVFTAHVDALTTEEAVGQARQAAMLCHDDNESDPDDYAVLAVFEGQRFNLATGRE